MKKKSINSFIALFNKTNGAVIEKAKKTQKLLFDIRKEFKRLLSSMKKIEGASRNELEEGEKELKNVLRLPLRNYKKISKDLMFEINYTDHTDDVNPNQNEILILKKVELNFCFECTKEQFEVFPQYSNSQAERNMIRVEPFNFQSYNGKHRAFAVFVFEEQNKETQKIPVSVNTLRDIAVVMKDKVPTWAFKEEYIGWDLQLNSPIAYVSMTARPGMSIEKCKSILGLDDIEKFLIGITKTK